MSRIESRILIDRPVEEVFAYMTDLDTWLGWQSGVLEVKNGPEGPLEVGSTFTIVIKVMGRESEVNYKVTEFEKDKKVVDRSPGNLTIENTITFGRLQDGAEINRVAELTASGFARIFLPIVSRTFRKQIESSYNTLKELLESDAG